MVRAAAGDDVPSLVRSRPRSRRFTHNCWLQFGQNLPNVTVPCSFTIERWFWTTEKGVPSTAFRWWI